jgi:hypothetical protein
MPFGNEQGGSAVFGIWAAMNCEFQLLGDRVLEGAEASKRRGETIAPYCPRRHVRFRQTVESRVCAGAGGQTGCAVLQTPERARIGLHGTLVQLF